MKFDYETVREALGEINFLLPSLISRLESTVPNEPDKLDEQQRLIGLLRELDACIENLVLTFEQSRALDPDDAAHMVSGYWQEFMRGLTKGGRKHGHVAGMTMITAASVSLLSAAGLPVALGSITALGMVFGQKRAERIVKSGISLVQNKGVKDELAIPKIEERPKLTQRQYQCLSLAAEGKPSHEIASILKLNITTVDNHIRLATYKLGTSSRNEAVKFAIENGVFILKKGT